MIDYVCHSGGCPGADLVWENEGMKYGVKTISYSFYNHSQKGKNQKILTVDELKEGYQHVLKANETLKRNIDGQAQYVKNLLSRNWFQVKNSNAIFAIGKLSGKDKVDGGTGWAVQMAIDVNKPVIVFDQIKNTWTGFDYSIKKFGEVEKVCLTNVGGSISVLLPHNFAGIGTREINKNGIEAIKNIYKYNFENASLI
jgi:hypothetical protein